MGQINTFTGGCHCGAVAFEVRTDATEVTECNCSICNKKGFLHLIVHEADVTWLRGRDQLSEYTFNTGTAKHWFCKHCGIHAIYRPRSHPDGYSVNARCLDGDHWRTLLVNTFDGRNWEASRPGLK
jgi:hypothetical protein